MAPSKQELRKIADMMLTLADELDRVPPKYVKRLASILEDARKETKARLKEWAEKIPGGGSRYTAHHHRMLLVQLEHTRKLLSKKFPDEMSDILDKGGRASSKVAMKNLVHEAARFSAVFSDDIQALDLEAIARVASGSRSVIRRHDVSAARYGADLLGWKKNVKGYRFAKKQGWTEQIERQLGLGLAQRESIDQITGRLVKLGGPLIDVAKRDGGIEIISEIPEGMFVRHRHRAEAIVRTELMESANAAKADAIDELNEEDPGYLKRWDATADSRTCAICRPLDGAVVETDESFDVVLRRADSKGKIIVYGKTTREHPPAHPNCRCSLTAWRVEWGDSRSVLQTIEEEFSNQGIKVS